MGIDAKPPVRRGSGAGLIVAAVALAAVCVPLLIVGAMLVSWFFARSASVPAHVQASPTYTSHSTAYPTYSPEFEARLNAANRIQGTTERDEALSILAAEFSQSTEEANQAILAIRDNDRRDDAAWKTARRFSELNRPQDSVTMIEMMFDQSTRDAAFRAVATGNWPERSGVTSPVPADDAVEVTTGAAADEAAH